MVRVYNQFLIPPLGVVGPFRFLRSLQRPASLYSIYVCMCLTYWYCLYIVDSSSNSQTPALLHTYIHKTTILEVPLLLLLLLPPHRIRVCACRYGHTVWIYWLRYNITHTHTYRALYKSKYRDGLSNTIL